MASRNGVRRQHQVSPASGGESASSVQHSNHRPLNDPLQGVDDNDGELSETQKQMYRVLLQHQESLNAKQRDIFFRLQRKVSRMSTVATAENEVNGVMQYSNESATVSVETQDATDQLKIELAASHTGIQVTNVCCIR
jgi:TolA-binding protein